MSISPPPFSPARSGAHGSDDEDVNDYVRDDDDERNNSARSLASSFDFYKSAIDRLRSSVKSSSKEDQLSSLEHFKPLSTRPNAWLYMRIHDDLFAILLEYLKIDDLPIQSTTLSVVANIACDQSSHQQIFETDLIDIVCRKVTDIDHIDIKNRCFRLLGNVCTVEDAAKKMIDADLARSMGDVLRTCTDPACLHSTIRCARKLSTYALCRDPMLDSMCLLSICKQLFASKAPLRKEAMKAVSEWNIESSDRSRAQLREGEIFRFLIQTIENQSEKEYRHLAFRLLDNLLRYSDMRTEFGLRQGLDFLLKMIKERQYQSIYEHFKYLGLYCVCCQEVNNRRLIKDDTNKIQLFFDHLKKYQYRSNFLDLLLSAIVQFSYDEQSLTIFVKQMQFIDRMSDLLESVVLIKYEMNERRLLPEDEQNPQDRKRMKTKHTRTTDSIEQRVPMMIDFNESVFTEFVANTHLEDEKEKQTTPNDTTSSQENIEIRRRTEGLIFILLSKFSYENTDSALRRHLYNRRLMSLLLRYISSCEEPNPRAIRILHRLTKQIDSPDQLIQMALPYSIENYFYPNRSSRNDRETITADDQYLLDILLHDNRAFFQRLSWSNDQHRLRAIEHDLLKNIEVSINTPFAINEIIRRLNDPDYEEKFQSMLTLVATIKHQNLQSILFDRCSGFRYLINPSEKQASFWALRTLVNRCLASRHSHYLDEFLNELQSHAIPPPVTNSKTVQLKVNDQQCITVNSQLLSVHSDYFKTLFNGSFAESQQKVIPFHLPATIPIESFEHLNDLLSDDQKPIQSDRLVDLFRLCDQYLFDYFPYRLVAHVLRQIRQGHSLDFVEIVSKPTLSSALIRAIFSHLLTSSNELGREYFFKLLTDYTDELRTLIQTFVQHKCWFTGQYSPFFTSSSFD